MFKQQDEIYTWRKEVVGELDTDNLPTVVANTKNLGLDTKPTEVSIKGPRNGGLASCRESVTYRD
jgi:hypothetical protein